MPRPSVAFSELFEGRIRAVLERASMFGSPREVEYTLCTLLAAWESLALDAEPFEWNRLWVEERTKSNSSKELSLSDVAPFTAHERLEGIPNPVLTRITSKVIRNLKQVRRDVFDYYQSRRASVSQERANALDRISTLFDVFVKNPIYRSGPSEIETSLLTLLQLWEDILLQMPSFHQEYKTLELWRSHLRGGLSLSYQAFMKEVGELPVARGAEQKRAYGQVSTGMKHVASRFREYLKQHSQYLAVSTG
mgnify:CR=1 FL=1